MCVPVRPAAALTLNILLRQIGSRRCGLRQAHTHPALDRRRFREPNVGVGDDLDAVGLWIDEVEEATPAGFALAPPRPLHEPVHHVGMPKLPRRCRVRRRLGRRYMNGKAPEAAALIATADAAPVLAEEHLERAERATDAALDRPQRTRTSSPAIIEKRRAMFAAADAKGLGRRAGRSGCRQEAHALRPAEMAR